MNNTLSDNNIQVKRLLLSIICAVIFVVLAVLLAAFTRPSIPSDLQQQILLYTRNKPYVKLSVAVITEDKTDITIYGHNAHEIEDTGAPYELGQLSRVFLGAITARAFLDQQLFPEEPVSVILPVPLKSYSPTVGDLVTSTSAYADYLPEISGRDGNPYSGYTDFHLLMDMTDYSLESTAPFVHSESDFGAAVLGTTLGDYYSSTYFTVLNDFVHMDLGLRNTNVGTAANQASKGYRWRVDDAYIASLGLTSTISDLSSFVRMILIGGIDYFDLSVTPQKEINNETNVGFFWHIDTKTGIISYGGNTAQYASKVLIDKQKGVAVVVLSNYPDDEYGSAEVLARTVFDVYAGQY